MPQSVELAAFSASFGEIVDEWLAGPVRNTWLTVVPVCMYVRKGAHAIDGGMMSTLDVANVEVASHAQARGFFTAALDVLRARNPYDGLFIENVLNPQLAEHLRRCGWLQLDDGVCYSFFESQEKGALRRLRINP